LGGGKSTGEVQIKKPAIIISAAVIIGRGGRGHVRITKETGKLFAWASVVGYPLVIRKGGVGDKRCVLRLPFNTGKKSMRQGKHLIAGVSSLLALGAASSAALASTISLTFTPSSMVSVDTTANGFADWVVPADGSPTGQRMAGADIITVIPDGGLLTPSNGGIANFIFDDGSPTITGMQNGEVRSTSGRKGPGFLVEAPVPANSSGVLTTYIGTGSPNTEIAADLSDGSANSGGAIFTQGQSGIITVPYTSDNATDVELGIYNSSFVSTLGVPPVTSVGFDGATVTVAVPEPASMGLMGLGAIAALIRRRSPAKQAC
jgi:PEP-CTERM motif